MRPILAAIPLMFFASAAHAQDNVTASPHNLTTLGPGTIRLATIPTSPVTSIAREEICVFCHTPHHGQDYSAVEAPLWNRAIGSTPYTMYSSPTIDMTIAAQPQGVSLACLSCHDGTIAFDQLRNGPGPGDNIPAATPRGWTFVGGVNNMTTSSYAFLDTDLSNDHPISVTYNTTADTMFNSQASVVAAGLRFFGSNPLGADQVECASCHNPHDPTNRPFLRINNDYSTLCKTCHIK